MRYATTARNGRGGAALLCTAKKLADREARDKPIIDGSRAGRRRGY